MAGRMNAQEAIEILESIYPSAKEIATGEYPHVADALDTALTALREKAAREMGCEWFCTDDDANLWECSECGAEWILEAGTPTDNDMHFCPACGKRLEVKKDERNE